VVWQSGGLPEAVVFEFGTAFLASGSGVKTNCFYLDGSVRGTVAMIQKMRHELEEWDPSPYKVRDRSGEFIPIELVPDSFTNRSQKSVVLKRLADPVFQVSQEVVQASVGSEVL